MLSTHGLADETFIRGKAPMTKAEIRMVSLGKLKLKKDSVCYDVGAGTGSVSVEMALRAYEGRVYAVEKKEDALGLLQENRQKFALDHMEIVAGTAPERAGRASCSYSCVYRRFFGKPEGNCKASSKKKIRRFAW